MLTDIKKKFPGNLAAKHFKREYYDSLKDEDKAMLIRCLRRRACSCMHISQQRDMLSLSPSVFSDSLSISPFHSGTYNPDSKVGCYAMRPEDYDTLRGFFAPLIAEYHGAAGRHHGWGTCRP